VPTLIPSFRLSELAAAVVGTGFIGPIHIEALKRIHVRVAGVLGTTPEKTERARAAHGVERAYATFDELLEDASVDAVHLAIPNALHFEYARRALAAGKHVMCEKPLAMDAAETGELVALARGSGLQAGVCYNVRYYPLNIEARHLVRSGEIGEVFSVAGSYAQDWLHKPTDYNWRLSTEQGGALRAVADIGTHWIDLVTTITGLKVEAVFADLRTVHPIRTRPVGEVETFAAAGDDDASLRQVRVTNDDWGAVLFRFQGGARGVLWVSQVAAGRKNCIRYEIGGARQTIAWESERPNELWVGRRDAMNGLLVRDPAMLSEAARHHADYPGGHNEGYPDTFKQCFRAFYEAIAGSASPPIGYPTFEDGHRELVLCEAILQSHRLERWITLA
jgi:predicted dehydrogenase